MKTIFFSLLLLCSTTLFAQVDHRPTSVRRGFEKDYPSVSNAQWEMRSGQWHGNFRDNNNRNVDVYYDRYGKRMDSRIAWNRNDFPKDLDTRVHSRYHVNGDYQVFRIERPRSTPLFEIRIGGRKPIYMDEHGTERRYYYHH